MSEEKKKLSIEELEQVTGGAGPKVRIGQGEKAILEQGIDISGGFGGVTVADIEEKAVLRGADFAIGR